MRLPRSHRPCTKGGGDSGTSSPALYDGGCHPNHLAARLAMPPFTHPSTVLTPFQSLFSAPTWRKVQRLLIGALLARGRRTITAAPGSSPGQAIRGKPYSSGLRDTATMVGPGDRENHAMFAGLVFHRGAVGAGPVPLGWPVSTPVRLVRQAVGNVQRRPLQAVCYTH